MSKHGVVDQLKFILETQESGRPGQACTELKKLIDTIEAQPQLTEQLVLSWLENAYVQRQDARQKEMGLQYMEAETHDLARRIFRRYGGGIL